MSGREVSRTHKGPHRGIRSPGAITEGNTNTGQGDAPGDPSLAADWKGRPPKMLQASIFTGGGGGVVPWVSSQAHTQSAELFL